MLLSILLGILGGQEILIIAILVLLMFGGKKIPELMRGLGKGIKEFKDAKDGSETNKEEDKTKRSSVPPGTNPATVDLPKALELLSLQKTLGVHPGNKKEIKGK